jgi:hypothetical protein
MEPQGLVQGSATPLSANTFTREGYTFNGWSTDPNGGGTTYTDGQSVTLTASGWSDYTWSIDGSAAHLSATTGKSVVVTAESGSASNAVVNVIATAAGSGSVSGSGTNSVSSAGYTAKAKIVVE